MTQFSVDRCPQLINVCRCVFTAVLKDAVVLHCLTDRDRLLHRTGAAFEKARSPNVLGHVVVCRVKKPT